ncbi:IS701 family transposase [Dactylosporangium sp. AC04546]|uniref:IS701 family transposase n=1 Tax=Dactylosporangium sp. AC04546 TaxID=2862460 RepID=UPI001EDF4467|nr:IS701 family transposase [Dactylosporangium sp. AC04546]WVK89675.1 IS701 family transposase [Dactylosporangium sp. AC04546]
MMEGALAVANLAELHGRLRACFRRVEPFRQAGKYVTALVSDLPRKNGWTIAEHAGDECPDPTQRLLNHAVWDHDAAMATIRGFVVEALSGQPLVVAALDESGQEKGGSSTVGVQRQYMGCAGRVANGVNTVYCSYATPGGHALVGARIYVPADQVADAGRRAAMGIGKEAVFRSKPQLAVDVLQDMVTDATMPSWCAGDEVYGRSSELRTFCEDNRIGYVLRVGRAFHTDLASGVRMRADTMVNTLLPTGDGWQIRAVPGSKGDRRYAWAWVATRSPHHFLLLRKHLQTGEVAYHHCHVPPGWPVPLMTLVRVACLRWPIEEDFEFGKDHFGLDHSQVRLYTALTRHLVLSMAALAVCGVTAAQAKLLHQNRSCRPARTRTHRRTPA